MKPPALLSLEVPGIGSAGSGGLMPAAADLSKWFEVSGSFSLSH